MQAGDLVCFDTDAIGVMNYAVDFSRTFLCGETPATDTQRNIYQIALEQLEHNASNIKAGRSFEDFARLAYDVPARHRDYGYYVLAHGLGMAGEHPNVPRVECRRIVRLPWRNPGEHGAVHRELHRRPRIQTRGKTRRSICRSCKLCRTPHHLSNVLSPQRVGSTLRSEVVSAPKIKTTISYFPQLDS